MNPRHFVTTVLPTLPPKARSIEELIFGAAARLCAMGTDSPHSFALEDGIVVVRNRCGLAVQWWNPSRFAELFGGAGREALA